MTMKRGWPFVGAVTVVLTLAAGAQAGQQAARSGSARVEYAVWKRPLPPKPISLRDPFAPLPLARPRSAREVVRPPGRAGLLIAELVVRGIVESPRGAVAVVADPDGHVYFLHTGDELFDGTVDRIEAGGVVFAEHARDALGRPMQRLVVKSIEAAHPEVRR